MSGEIWPLPASCFALCLWLFFFPFRGVCQPSDLLGFIFLSCAYREARTKKEKKEKKERGEGRKPWGKVERITRLVREERARFGDSRRGGVKTPKMWPSQESSS